MSLHLLTRAYSSERQAKKLFLVTKSTLPSRTAVHPLVQLQHTVGNRRVDSLVQTRRVTAETGFAIQPKLVVGPAHDHYEQEADAVANRVMTMPAPAALGSVQRQAMPDEKEKEKALQTKPLASSITPFVQRQTAPDEDKEQKPVQTRPLADSITPLVQREMIPEEDKEKKPVQAKLLTDWGTPTVQREKGTEEEKEKKEQPIQTKLSVQRAAAGESFQAGEDLESRLSRSKGGGSHLPDHVRAYMEPRFGVDFSGVRVHTGHEASQMNQAVGAQAFTHGQDIYFGTGKGPDVSDLTAHELTHVVQQTGGVQAKLQRACAACEAGGPTCPTCEVNQERKVQRSTRNPVTRASMTRHAWGLASREEKDQTGQRIKRKTGDGHDLTSPRFVGDPILEACYDDQARLTVGAHGESVKKVQQALIDLGYNLGPKGADSNYGSRTWNAVKQFKTKEQLGWEHMGDVGPGTMKRLDELFGPRPTPPPGPVPPKPLPIPPPTPAFPSTLEFWFNAFIPNTVGGAFKSPAGPFAGRTVIPCPPLPFHLNSCFETDDRGFSSTPGVSSRVRVAAVLDTVTRALTFTHASDPTFEIDCATGTIKCIKTPRPTISLTLLPDVVSPSDFTIIVSAAGNDPCLTAAPDLAIRGVITINRSARTFTFTGATTFYPAFEMYGLLGTTLATIFSRSPIVDSPFALLLPGAAPVTQTVLF